jgi:hypothetical protein
MVYFGVLLTISLFSLFIIWEVNKSLKEQNDTLIFLNKKLNDDLNSALSKNAALWTEINSISSISEVTKNQLEELLAKQETFEIPIGSKVKWFDKVGNEEFGVVYDDFKTPEKHLVVVRGINKGKLTGRYFTVSLERISIID